MVREIKIIGKCDIIALVDDDDYYKLSTYKWYYSSNGYPITKTKQNGKKVTCQMHDMIFEKKVGFQIDHANRDGFDNRKCNLRYCIHSQNQMNRSKWISKSIYKGVRLRSKCKNNPWEASISKDKRTIVLGYFKTEVEAALAYNQAARQLFKDFACLNII